MVDTNKNQSTSVDYSTTMETPNKHNELSSSIVVDPMSPTALAEAAYAAGAEHRKKRDEERSGKPEVESLRETQENDDFQNSNKRRRLFGSEQNSDPSHNEPISNRSIEEVVGDLNRSDHNEELKSIVFRELDKLIQGGLEAFLKKDELERELAQVKDLSEGRGREVQKLKASEENSRASLSVSLTQSETRALSLRLLVFKLSKLITVLIYTLLQELAESCRGLQILCSGYVPCSSNGSSSPRGDIKSEVGARYRHWRRHRGKEKGRAFGR